MIQLETNKQFDELIHHKTVMLFSADWCPDCRYLEPIIPELEEEFPEQTFVYVDRDLFLNICTEHGIFGIPSFIVFDKGEESGRFVSKNRKTKSEIESFLKRI
ncbi:thioredoxin family protein [Thalassobacillus pellis]|uniref:thioredoxin family protein n=1 Tax=Thalassobacillus pellis TaxID=748008 RepID=UPI0019604DD3|nr:thioredoxin family protein [Thalassobacillus pellis]MBM7554926.1 thiol-disulfide isomerase/thioredoxin [Thalassobacillus pellis]